MKPHLTRILKQMTNKRKFWVAEQIKIELRAKDIFISEETIGNLFRILTRLGYLCNQRFRNKSGDGSHKKWTLTQKGREVL